MDELWFEDELSLPDQTIDQVSKNIARSTADSIESISSILALEACGSVRAYKPDWGLLTSDEKKNILNSGRDISLFKVRLIFEYEISQANFNRGVRFTSARCEGHIRSASGVLQPEVYDLFPKDLYEGEPQKVSLKFGPEITVDKIGVSVGEIGTDVTVGQVAPVIVGYFGNKKQEPHWDMRPMNKSLLGRQYFWLILAMPKGCEGIRLFCRAEGDIQTRLGPIAISPKETVWNNRPSILIHE